MSEIESFVLETQIVQTQNDNDAAIRAYLGTLEPVQFPDNYIPQTQVAYTESKTKNSVNNKTVKVVLSTPCELCGFQPKTKNKYREKQDHLIFKHFKDQLDNVLPQSRPYICPAENCFYEGKDKQAIQRHFCKHGILEKLLKEALENLKKIKQNQVDLDQGISGTKKKIVHGFHKHNIHCVQGELTLF